MREFRKYVVAYELGDLGDERSDAHARECEASAAELYKSHRAEVNIALGCINSHTADGRPQYLIARFSAVDDLPVDELQTDGSGHDDLLTKHAGCRQMHT